jgi:hypothetical protein
LAGLGLRVGVIAADSVGIGWDTSGGSEHKHHKNADNDASGHHAWFGLCHCHFASLIDDGT